MRQETGQSVSNTNQYQTEALGVGLTLLHDLSPEPEAGPVEVLLLSLGEDVLGCASLDKRQGSSDLFDLEDHRRVVLVDVTERGKHGAGLVVASLLDEPSRRLKRRTSKRRVRVSSSRRREQGRVGWMRITYLWQLEDGGHEDDGEDDLERDRDSERRLIRHKEERKVEPVRDHDPAGDYDHSTTRGQLGLTLTYVAELVSGRTY